MLWWTKAKLKSESADTRLQAVYELSQADGTGAAESLADALKDKDWRVQRLAARALITRGDSRGLSFLIKMLGTSAGTEAEDLLLTVGDAAIGPLVAALTPANSQVSHAVSALKRLNWMPESPAHRAIFAVGEGRYEEAATFGAFAVDPLIAALRERHTAAEDIVKALGDTGGPRCVGPLIQVLGSESAPERSAAIKALQGVGLGAVARLVEALRHENPRVREGAALTLGEIHDPETIEPLLKAFVDPDPGVQAAVAFALGEIRHPLAVKSLIEALGRSSDHLRRRIFHALGRTGDPRAAAALAMVVHEKRLDIRSQEVAAEALKQLPCGEPLIQSLASTNQRLRDWALTASKQLHAPNRIELLGAALKDQDAEVREKVADFLGELKDEQAVELLLPAMRDSEESVSRAVAKALVNIGSSQAVDSLMQTLQAQETGARRWAAVALGEFADSRAVESLRRALHDADSGVRTYAAKALARAAGSGAVESLSPLLDDSEARVREAAVYSLAGIDDTRATALVEEGLSRDDLVVRTAATKAWKRKAKPSGFPALLRNLKTPTGELPLAAAESLEAVLGRSSSALSSEALKAVEQLTDTMTVEGGKTSTQTHRPIEIDCRHLKQMAYRELIRRGLAV